MKANKLSKHQIRYLTIVFRKIEMMWIKHEITCTCLLCQNFSELNKISDKILNTRK